MKSYIGLYLYIGLYITKIGL